MKLAGGLYLDGDGHLRMAPRSDRKAGSFITGLVITAGKREVALLFYVRALLGGYGSVLPQGRAKLGTCWVYKLDRASVLREVLLHLEPFVRGVNRLPQLEKLRSHFGQPAASAAVPTAVDPSLATGWMAGFFTADGCISSGGSRGGNTAEEASAVPGEPEPQQGSSANHFLVLNAVSTHEADLEPFRQSFGGTIRVDANGNHVWQVCSPEQIEAFSHYYQRFAPADDPKLKRLQTVAYYYKLRSLKAYDPQSTYHPLWIKLKSSEVWKD